MDDRNSLILARNSDHTRLVARNGSDGTQVSRLDEVVAPVERRGSSLLRDFDRGHFLSSIIAGRVLSTNRLSRRGRKFSDQDGTGLQATQEVTAASGRRNRCNLSTASKLDCRGTNLKRSSTLDIGSSNG